MAKKDDDGQGKGGSPTCEDDITCPICKGKMHVKMFKRRTTPAQKIEYDVESEVEAGVQGQLKGVDKKPNDTNSKVAEG